MFRNRIIYLCFLAGIAAFYVFYEGWFALFALWVTLLLPFFSALMSMILFRRVRIRLITDKQLVVGDDFRLTAVFTEKKDNKETTSADDDENTRFLLLPGCRFILSRTDLITGKVLKKKMVIGAPKYQAQHEEILHTGTYRFAALHCRLTDMLGILSLRFPAPRQLTVTVYPKSCMPIPAPDVRALLPVSFKPSLSQGFSEITDIRDYRPGDPMRAVHWKLSAKSDDLLVKDPQDPVMREIWVVLCPDADRERLDISFGEFLWLSDQLVQSSVPFTLVYAAGSSTFHAVVDSRAARDECMKKLLKTQIRDIPEDLPSIPLNVDRVLYIPERSSAS